MCSAVRTLGYEPQIHYVPYNWSDNRTPEGAAEYLLKRLDKPEQPNAVKAKALEIAGSLCNPDGVFVDAVNTKVAWIYWNTEGVSL